MRKTAILLALACAFARADYGPGTTDSDLLRSGTPVVTNAWLAVSNETARLVENHVPEVDASRITDGTNAIDAARNVYATSHNWQFTGQRDDDEISLSYESDTWTMTVFSDSLGTDSSSIVTNENVTRLVFNFPDGIRAYSITAFRNVPTYVGRLALTNDIPDVSGYATQQQATNAALAVADAKISTNNAAFVSAVLAVPLAGADAGDLAEIAEYGGYGTVGAAILALIAGLAALKRRVASAETALAQKANASDLPYALVTLGEWVTSISGYTVAEADEPVAGAWWSLIDEDSGTAVGTSSGNADSTSLSFTFGPDDTTVTATRSFVLLDRAGNRVVVSGDTTLTLPALEHAGRLRDFLVRLEISGSTVPTITFAAPTGETITYETDGDEFPVPDETGSWSYSFTENCVAHTFAVSLKKVNTVAAPQAQGGA